MNEKTLQSLLVAGAQSNLGITYLQGEEKEKSLSYKELYSRALALLGHFQERGISAGDQVILLVNSNERLIDAFWACMLGGMLPVPLAMGISTNHKEKIFGVFEQLATPFIYTSEDNLQRLKDFSNGQGKQSTYEQLEKRSILTDQITALSNEGQIHLSRPEDIAFIQFSSGSTSKPKGVPLTHENLLANIEAMILGAELQPQDSTLGWMPLTHDMGLIGFHLVPLAKQLQQYLIPTDLFVRRPMLWLEKISQHKVTVSCSPNFGFKHLLQYFKKEHTQHWDLKHLRLILNGAEPISAPLCRDFLEQMAPYGMDTSVMFPVYGLAEASLAVSFPVPGANMQTVLVDREQLKVGQPINALTMSSDKTLEMVVLGKPVKHCQVTIVDNESMELPEGHVGHILISGTNVTKGYYNHPQDDRQVFNNQGLNTGDLGFIIDQQLVVCGRSKDILFVNGQNYYPHDLEAALDPIVGSELGKTVVCGVKKSQHQNEQPAVFVLHKGSAEEFAELALQIRKRLNEHIGLEISIVLPIRKIPKTTSGKVQRYLLAAQYAEGAFDEIEKEFATSPQAQSAVRSELEGTDVEMTLLSICQEFLKDQQVGVNDNLFELGTSSLVLTQIHDRIDTIWPDRLDLTDYFDYPTVAELASFLSEESQVS